MNILHEAGPPVNTQPTKTNPIPGKLGLNSYAGVIWTDVLIIGQTPQKYRIQAIERTRLSGNHRYLDPSESALVPRYAVRLEPTP